MYALFLWTDEQVVLSHVAWAQSLRAAHMCTGILWIHWWDCWGFVVDTACLDPALSGAWSCGSECQDLFVWNYLLCSSVKVEVAVTVSSQKLICDISFSNLRNFTVFSILYFGCIFVILVQYGCKLVSDIAAYVFVFVGVLYVCLPVCVGKCMCVCAFFCNRTKMSQGFFFSPFLITNANVTLMKSA